MRWLLAAAAVYTGALLVRYFFPPHAPRYPLESAFMIFVAAGVAAVIGRVHRTRPTYDPGGTRPTYDSFALLLVGGALLIYAPALTIGFLSDDLVIARWARNGDLVHLADTGFVRPGVPLLWGALEALPGDLAAAAHLTNVVLHGVNAWLVVICARRLGLGSVPAIAAAVLFLAFPGLSEAIVWASGVQDVLMTTGCLAAVALSTSGTRRGLAGGLAATAAALLVKETAVAAPALAALVVWGRGDRLTQRPHARALTALTIVAGIYAAVRVAFGLPAAFVDVPDWRYFVKQLVAGAFASLGAPWTAAWARAYPVMAFGRAVLVLAMFTTAFATWRRGDAAFRRAAAAAAWVLAGVLPVFSLFYVGPWLEGSRYLYLPAAGFALLLAIAIDASAAALPKHLRVPLVAALTLLLAGPAVAAIRSDIARWQTAASTRDAILAAAPRTIAGSPCGSFVAEGLADSVDGAFVFRHGLPEAMGMSGEGVRCRLSWDGSALSVAPLAP